MKWEGLSGRHVARVYDISLGGCYVETIGQVACGELINFEIQLPTGRWLRLRGEVLHAQQHMGFGLRLIDVSDEQHQMLSLRLEYAAAGGAAPLARVA